MVGTCPSGGSIKGGEDVLPKESMGVKVRLQSEGFNSHWIEINSSENSMGIILGGIFKGVCSLEAWSEEVEV